MRFFAINRSEMGIKMKKYGSLLNEYEQLQKEYEKVLSEKAELAYSYERLREKQEKVRAQDEEIRKLHGSARMLKHDMKNHFMVMSSYLATGEYEAAALYSSEILDKLNAMHSYVETGNSLLNHIVNEKLKMAQERGIRIKAEIENLPFDSMKSIDFSALLGNMMDNAIRACGSEEAGGRELHLFIISQRGYGMICVKNKIAESVLEKNPALLSSKESARFPGKTDADGRESHGIGIPGMREITERYHGIFDIYESEGFFCVSAYIPE